MQSNVTPSPRKNTKDEPDPPRELPRRLHIAQSQHHRAPRSVPGRPAQSNKIHFRGRHTPRPQRPRQDPRAVHAARASPKQRVGLRAGIHHHQRGSRRGASRGLPSSPAEPAGRAEGGRAARERRAEIPGGNAPTRRRGPATPEGTGGARAPPLGGEKGKAKDPFGNRLRRRRHPA